MDYKRYCPSGTGTHDVERVAIASIPSGASGGRVLFDQLFTERRMCLKCGLFSTYIEEA
jgi:hypothetical protein